MRAATTCSAIAATAATPSSCACRCRTSSPIPDAIGFVEAAAFPLTFLTAWHMLITRAQAARRRRRAGARRRQRRRPGGDPDRVAARRARVRHRRHRREAGQGARSSAPTRSINHTTQDRAGEGPRVHQRPRRRRRGRARRRGDVGAQPEEPRRAAGGWSPAARRPATTRRSICAFLFARQLSLLGSYMGTQGASCCARRSSSSPASCVRSSIGRSRSPRPPTAHRRLEAREQFGKVVLVV